MGIEKRFGSEMDTAGSVEITRLLKAWGAGDRAALERLMPAVYHELPRRARAYMRHQPSDHTLQPTALVHEAVLHLVDTTSIDWQDRAHFLRYALRRCDAFWWIRRAPVRLRNAAAERES